MDDDSDNFYREIRYSRLKDQDEHSSPTNRKPKINGSATQNSDLYPDSGFNSDVSTGNGDIAGKACSDRVNGLGTLHENHVKHGYRTLEVPEGEKSDSNNGGNSSEQIPEQKFSFKTLTKDQKVILASTSFTNLLSYLSLSILAPFFPKEANDKNVNDTISGWIFGSFALVQFLTSPIFGKLMPYVGSRFMYLSGLFICGGCTLIFGCLHLIDTEDGIWTFVSFCFVVRAFLALGCTSLNNSGFVMIVKAFPCDIATVFGIGEVFTGVGMVTGPALGGFLYSAGGFVTPFAVIGGACFLALPLVYYNLPNQDDSLSEESNLPITGILCHPRSVVNSLAVMVSAAIWAILDPTLEPHLRVYGLSSELVGILFLVMAACYSLVSPIWGWLADRLTDNRLMLIPGFILAAAGLLLIGPSPVLGFALSYNEIWLTILSLIILGIASSLCIIPTYDIYLSVLEELEYPEDTRTFGMVSGLWVSMYALGDFAGPSLGGFLYQEIGFEWMASYTGALCLFTSVVVFISWLFDTKCKPFCKKRKIKSKVITDEKKPLLGDSIGSYDDNSGSLLPGTNGNAFERTGY